MSRHHRAVGSGTRALRRSTWLATTDRICGMCGRPGATTVDHITPLALGGADHPDNWRPAHRRCNSAAGARLGNALRRAPLTTSRQW